MVRLTRSFSFRAVFDVPPPSAQGGSNFNLVSLEDIQSAFDQQITSQFKVDDGARVFIPLELGETFLSEKLGPSQHNGLCSIVFHLHSNYKPNSSFFRRVKTYSYAQLVVK